MRPEMDGIAGTNSMCSREKRWEQMANPKCESEKRLVVRRARRKGDGQTEQPLDPANQPWQAVTGVEFFIPSGCSDAEQS